MHLIRQIVINAGGKQNVVLQGSLDGRTAGEYIILQFNIRMLKRKIPEKAAQMSGMCKFHGDPNPDRTCTPGIAAAQPPKRTVTFIDQVRSLLEQYFSRFGKRHGVTVAKQQCAVQLLLQLLNVPGEHRLGNIERFCSFAEAQQICKDLKFIKSSGVQSV